MGIFEDLKAEGAELRQDAGQFFTRGKPAAVPIFTPKAQTVQPAPASQETNVTIGQTIHKDVSAAGAAIQHAWQFTQQIAANPNLDELMEVGLDAIGQGVAAEAFQAATDALRGAIARKAGTVDQVAAAVDAGQQAVQAAAPVSNGPQAAAMPKVMTA